MGFVRMTEDGTHGGREYTWDEVRPKFLLLRRSAMVLVPLALLFWLCSCAGSLEFGNPGSSGYEFKATSEGLGSPCKEAKP